MKKSGEESEKVSLYLLGEKRKKIKLLITQGTKLLKEEEQGCEAFLVVLIPYYGFVRAAFKKLQERSSATFSQK